jgi:hypothetical protein
MLLETCRYQFVDGKVITKMFGMKGNDWDIEKGWHHSPKDAKAAVKKTRKPRAKKVISNDDSTGLDQQLS